MTTEQEALDYFKSLSYKGQRRFYGKLAVLCKSPSYSLGFNLNPKGVSLMGRAVQYCSEQGISYTPKKVHNRRVKFVFDDAATRNCVLLGAMGGRRVTDPDQVDIACEYHLEEDEVLSDE